MDALVIRTAAGVGAVKGAVIAATTSALGIPFWQAIIVALVSGSLGVTGAIVSALIAARESRKNRTILHDVKRKMGADQRARDKEEAG